ncbi:hypothetical protein D9M68_808430 [compost metagenome]
MAEGNTALELGNKGLAGLGQALAGLCDASERRVQRVEVRCQARRVGFLETFATEQQQAAGGAAGMHLHQFQGWQFGGAGQRGEAEEKAEQRVQQDLANHLGCSFCCSSEESMRCTHSLLRASQEAITRKSDSRRA